MGKQDQPNPLEVVQATQEKILERLAEMAQVQADQAELLKALAEKVTTGKPAAAAVTVKGTARTCSRGHAMQISDDYCQHCWREDHPDVKVGRFRPPRSTSKVETIPLGDPPAVTLPEIPEPPEPTAA